jgi:hypothetical protein
MQAARVRVIEELNDGECLSGDPFPGILEVVLPLTIPCLAASHSRGQRYCRYSFYLVVSSCFTNYWPTRQFPADLRDDENTPVWLKITPRNGTPTERS